MTRDATFTLRSASYDARERYIVGIMNT